MIPTLASLAKQSKVFVSIRYEDGFGGVCCFRIQDLLEVADAPDPSNRKAMAMVDKLGQFCSHSLAEKRPSTTSFRRVVTKMNADILKTNSGQCPETIFNTGNKFALPRTFINLLFFIWHGVLDHCRKLFFQDAA